MNFLKNYFSTLLMLFFGYILYTQNTFYNEFITKTVSLSFVDISLFIPHIFYTILGLYLILLVPLYLIYPHASKARLTFRYCKKVLTWNNNFEEKEKTSLMAWIVKLFFAPLMITWLTEHIFSLGNNWYNLVQNISLFQNNFLLFFDSYFFWTAFSTILFIDVLFFTLWYLIEAPVFKNTIRSVEPTLIWWAACILCYPPFNTYTTQILSWQSTDFPTFSITTIHVWFNIFLLILMCIYAWASLSLGLKASNLTNRWIISHGPYKYIRHPAYICKNLAWIIGGIPMIILAWSSENMSLFSVCIGLFGWAFIYYVRAMTEENHLSLDPEYREYKKQVPYKFIPKIW